MPACGAALWRRRRISRERKEKRVIEAAMIWNEPNNKSHWDPEIDPDWSRFSRMAILAGEAIKAQSPRVTRVLGGISPIDPNFIPNLSGQGVLNHVDVVAGAPHAPRSDLLP